MRKLFIAFLTFSLSFGLVACGENKSGVKSYPISSSSIYMDEAIPMPDEIYTTNDSRYLIGSVFYFDGKVTDSGNFNGADYVKVENENGSVLLIDVYNHLRNTADDETFDSNMAEDDSDYTLPDVSENVHVIATYAGYSEAMKMPSLYLGANPFIVERYRQDN